ncbi:MAG: DUF5368 family protein [Rubrimonas sp.]
MKEMTLGMVIAVLEEMFGRGLFWALLAGGVLVALAFLFVMIRDRGAGGRGRSALTWLAMIAGGAGAAVFVFTISNSGLRHIGGPLDVFALLAIFAAGAAAAGAVAHTAQALLHRPAASEQDEVALRRARRPHMAPAAE